MSELIMKLHKNEVFQASLKGLTKEEIKVVTEAAESLLKELSIVLEASHKLPEVVSTEDHG